MRPRAASRPVETPVSAGTAAAAVTLGADAAAALAFDAFQVDGIETLVLRGPAIADWLYGPDERREYRDVDLLIPPGRRAAAATALERLGFRRFLEGVDEIERTPHADTYIDGGGRAVDLHWTLRGVGVPDLAWEVLSADAKRLRIADRSIQVPSIANRALIVALHAAQHSGLGRAGEDLDRAVSVADETIWRSAAESAERLEATAALATGLRLYPGGKRVLGALGLETAGSIDLELRAGGSAAPLTLGLARLADTPGATGKARLLFRKLFPSPAYVRIWAPWARRGPGALTFAYLARPLWLLAQAPRAALAYLRAAARIRARDRDAGQK